MIGLRYVSCGAPQNQRFEAAAPALLRLIVRADLAVLTAGSRHCIVDERVQISTHSSIPSGSMPLADS